MASFKIKKYKNGKIGYESQEVCNEDIAPLFDEGVEVFGTESWRKSPYACVIKDSKCGIINEEGDIVVPFEYEEAYPLSEKLFAVRKTTNNGEWLFGAINLEGACVIPFEYKFIEKRDEFICCTKKATSKRIYSEHGWGGKRLDYKGHIFNYKDIDDYCWMDINGKIIYEGSVVRSISDVLIIEKSGKLGAIDLNGDCKLDYIYEEIYYPCKNHFIVRKNIDESEWRFGVLDENHNIFIPFEYKFIESQDGSFYKCYKKCDCKYFNNQTFYSKYEYSNKNEVVWLNRDGKEIITGEATILSEAFLRVEKNGKYGVYNQQGQRIVNFIYDHIIDINGKIGVIKDKKVGILGENGEIVIDTSYDSIECVHLTNGEYGGILSSKKYGKFSKTHPFDTSEQSKLARRRFYIDRTVKHTGDFLYEDKTVFILQKKEYSELFTLNEGILPESSFESIYALTNISFAVKRNDKWGVYRADVKKIIIECDYDRLIFEGSHTVMLCKDNLWGAKTLVLADFIFFRVIFDVDVPLKFHEIRIIDSAESLFSVKCEEKNYKDEIVYYYTIVGKHGEEACNMISLQGQSHFVYFSNDKVLSYNGRKYGFINMNGYTSIPFKYDLVEKRNDGMFDVCIDETWGVLGMNGKEIVQIKYSERIPDDYDHLIVKDKISDCYGILDEKGNEFVPSIYEHLMFSDDKEYIFFGYNGYESEDGNFFSDSISNGIWGCLNNLGEEIIEAKYDCFKIVDGYILAGRDGGMLYHDDSCYGSEYSGVYDLYTRNGELVYGGFRKFFYNKENDIYVFFLGGEWKSYSSLVDEWNNIYIHDYSFNPGVGLWLFLDKDLKSVIRDSEGNQIEFKKGSICKIETKKEDNKRTFVYNQPIKVMAKGFDEIIGKNIIIADCNDNDKRNLAALNITNGALTPFFSKIKVVGDTSFFVSENRMVGLRTYNKTILESEYLFFTIPVNGFYFAAKEIDEEYSNLVLRSLSDEQFELVAVNKIKTTELIDKAAYGRLKIEHEGNDENIDGIILSQHKLFDDTFIAKVSNKESNYFCHKHDDIYWFADDYRMEKHIHSSQYDNYDDDHDYMRDTWDAMTDGMYGDMPDGFDGDFDFLGR